MRHAILDEDGRVGAIDADRFARFAAVADVLGGRASKQPVAIVLDDAHLADAAATLLTRFVVRTLHQTRCRRRHPSHRRRRSGRDATHARRARARRHRDRPRGLRRRDHRVDARRARAARRELRPGAGARPAHRRQPLAVESRRRRTSDDRRVACPRPRDRALARCAVAGAPRRRRPGGDPRRRRCARRRGRDGRRGPRRMSSRRWSGRRTPGSSSSATTAGRSPTISCAGRRSACSPPARRWMPTSVRSAWRPGDDRPGGVGPACASTRSPPPGAPTRTLDGPSPSVATRPGCWHEASTTNGRPRLLESAVELVERRPPPDHLEVVLEWADALLVCGRLADARRAYARADELATRAGDPVAHARAALGLGGVWLNEHRSAADRARVLGRQRTALAALAGDSSDIAVGLRARLGLRLAAEAVYDGAPVAPVLAALAASRATGDLAVLAEGLSLTHHALLAPEHLEARRLLADELIERVGPDRRRPPAAVRVALAHRRPLPGRRPGPTRDLAELRTRADAVGCRSIGYIASAIDVMQLIRDGRLDEAEAAAHATFEQGVDVGDADATGYYGAHLLTIRWFQDRDGELTDLARDIATSSMLVVPEFAYRAAAATIAARAGRTDEAATLLSPLRRVGLAALPRSSTWLSGIVNIVEVAAITGDTELAQQAYPLLVPFAGAPGHAVAGDRLPRVGRAGPRTGGGDLRRRRPSRRAPRRAVAANIRLGNRPMTAIAAPTWRTRWPIATRRATAPRRSPRSVRPLRPPPRSTSAGAGGVGRVEATGSTARLEPRSCCGPRVAAGRSTPAPGTPSCLISSASGTCTPWWHDPAARCRPWSCAAVSTSAGPDKRSSIRRRCAATGTASPRSTTSSSRPGLPARTGGSSDSNTSAPRCATSCRRCSPVRVGRAGSSTLPSAPNGGAQGDRPRPRGDRRAPMPRSPTTCGRRSSPAGRAPTAPIPGAAASRPAGHRLCQETRRRASCFLTQTVQKAASKRSAAPAVTAGARPAACGSSWVGSVSPRSASTARRRSRSCGGSARCWRSCRMPSAGVPAGRRGRAGRLEAECGSGVRSLVDLDRARRARPSGARRRTWPRLPGTPLSER